MRILLRFFLVIFAATTALARNVIYVDNSRDAGVGSYESPFAKLGEAQAASHDGDIIYVAEGSAAYEEGLTLKRGQVLIGAAYGLDAAAIDFHLQFDSPSVPAVQGPGPTIHGGVSLGGDNIVAGCTIAIESGFAIVSSVPDASVTLRRVYIKATKYGAGVALQSAGAVSIVGGGIEGLTLAAGLSLSGGSGDVSIERFPITGTFGTAVGISQRQRGKIVFHGGSPVKVSTSQDAIVLADSAASIAFADPLQISTQRGRGLVASNVNVAISDGRSRVETLDTTALEIRDSKLDVSFEAVSASGVLANGILLEKVRGKFVVTGSDGKSGTGGTIRGATSYGIRIAQSSGIRLSHMTILDSGSADARCLDATVGETNVRCRGAVYLRHVSGSKFEDITISGGAGVGLNANNITDVSFSGLQIAGAGSTAQEPALLLQEAIGRIAFSTCRIAEGAGGGEVIEQRFNGAQLSFERCELGSLRIRTSGAAKLQVEIESSYLHGNAGSLARENSRARLDMHRSQVVDVTLRSEDSAEQCLDMSANQISGSVHLAGGSFALIGALPGESAAETIARANSGARAVVDSKTRVAGACRE